MSLPRHRKWVTNFKGYIRSRRVMLSLLAVLVGVASGIGAILFRVMISLNNYLFFDAILPFISLKIFGYNLSVALLPALGGLIAG